jgi:hypothetical protein
MTVFSVTPRTTLAIAVALALTACGGGGGGGSTAPAPTSAPVTPPQPTTAPTAAPVPVILAVKGVAYDGYLAGASVYLDLNNNGARDAGEPLTNTDTKGNFSLSIDQATAGLANARLRVSGGTDLATNQLFTSSMSAVFGEPSTSRTSYPITPLTTVVDAMVRADPTTTLLQARENLAKVMGLSSTTALDADPVTMALNQPSLLQKMVAIQKSMEILATTDKKPTEPNTAAATGRAASAIGAVIKTSAATLPAQPQPGQLLPSVSLLVSSAVANQSTFFSNVPAVRAAAPLAADVANLTEATIAASVSQLLRDFPTATGTALTNGVANYVDTRIAALAALQNGASAVAVQTAANPPAAGTAPVRLDTVATNTNVNDQLKALVQATLALTTVPLASSAPSTVIDNLQQVVSQVPTQLPNAPPTAAPTAGPPTTAPTTPPTEAPTEPPTEAPTTAPTVAPTPAPTAAPTAVTVALTSLSGSFSAPATYDAASGAGKFKFTTNVATASFVRITNFSANDSLAFTGVGTNHLVVANNGADVLFTVNINGTVTQVTLVGVVSPAVIIGSLATFNALNIGQVTSQ